MTQLLERALAQVAQLPDAEQDAIASVILEELEDKARWQAGFEQSPGQLAVLAREARAESSGGRTRELDPDDL